MRVLPRSCLWEAGSHCLFYAVCYLGLLAAALAAPLLKQGAPPDALLVFMVDQIVLLSLFALPLAFVTALLTTVGRMREDGEITALMAAGVSSWRVCRAFLPLAVLLAVWLGTACHWLLPQATRNLLAGRSELLQQALVTQIRRRLPLYQKEGETLAAVALERDRLHHVFAILRTDGGGLLAAFAPEARWTSDPDDVEGLLSDEERAQRTPVSLGLELRSALVLHREGPGRDARVLTGLAPSYTLAVPGRTANLGANADAVSTPRLYQLLAATPDDREHRTRRRSLERAWHLRFCVPVAGIAFWSFACGLALAMGRGGRLLSVFLGLVTVVASLLPGYALANGLQDGLAVNAGWVMWPPIVLCGAAGAWLMWRHR